MLEVFKHKKTGNLYVVDTLIKIKIPLIGYWVSFTSYRSYIKSEDIIYVRLTCLFNKAFVKATPEVFRNETL